MLSHLASLAQSERVARPNKWQIPTSKIQRSSNSKHQSTVMSSWVFGIWGLELLWILVLGASKVSQPFLDCLEHFAGRHSPKTFHWFRISASCAEAGDARQRQLQRVIELAIGAGPPRFG